jgi:hypothetical protein
MNFAGDHRLGLRRVPAVGRAPTTATPTAAAKFRLEFLVAVVALARDLRAARRACVPDHHDTVNTSTGAADRQGIGSVTGTSR